MQVRVNGKLRDMATPVDVAALVREVTQRDEALGVAVALNGCVVGRGEWHARTLADGDHVEILEASAGG